MFGSEEASPQDRMRGRGRPLDRSGIKGFRSVEIYCAAASENVDRPTVGSRIVVLVAGDAGGAAVLQISASLFTNKMVPSLSMMKMTSSNRSKIIPYSILNWGGALLGMLTDAFGPRSCSRESSINPFGPSPFLHAPLICVEAIMLNGNLVCKGRISMII